MESDARMLVLPLGAGRAWRVRVTVPVVLVGALMVLGVTAVAVIALVRWWPVSLFVWLGASVVVALVLVLTAAPVDD